MKKIVSRLMSATAIVLILSMFMIPKHTLHAEIADGTYQINYEMKEADNNNTSIANGYFTSPATLTVKDGVKYVQLTITSSSMVKSLSTPTGPVDIVKENKSNETRTVRFRVDQDLSKPLSMEMHIVVPDLYDTTHTARAVFDTSGLETASQDKKTKENQSGSKQSKNDQNKQQKNNTQANTKQNNDTSQSDADNETNEQQDTDTKSNNAEGSDQKTNKSKDDEQDQISDGKDTDSSDTNDDGKDNEDEEDEEKDIGKNANEAETAGEIDTQTKTSQKNAGTSSILWISLIAIGAIAVAGLVFWIIRKNRTQ